MTEKTLAEFEKQCATTKRALQDENIHGPWDTEPNRVEFKHAGLDCMVIRHPRSFHLCGYVGVKPGHKCFDKGYDEVQSGKWSEDYNSYEVPAIVPDLEVHGGLTYAHECSGHICHITADEDKTWWFGFDCAHSGDLSPSFLSLGGAFAREDAYRDIEYVKAETSRLAEQLARVV